MCDCRIVGRGVSAIYYSGTGLRAIQEDISRNGPGSLEKAARKHCLSLQDLLVLNCSVVTNN